jgi:hypothetical protein
MGTRPLPRGLVTILVAGMLALIACSSGDGEPEGASAAETTPAPPVSPTVVPSVTPSVTPPSLPAEPPPTSGPATQTCVKGWVTPPRGSSRAGFPLDIIRRTTGVKGPLEVVEMRYFEGPESPPSEMGYLQDIGRWYVKLYARVDPAFQGRFLVESRRFGSGVSAVAAYDTSGWVSPDWIGFQYDSADTSMKAYPGLPGTWQGIPYDFVKGGGGIQIPGLPEEVVGCLDGT